MKRSTAPKSSLAQFRQVFAAIWLIYDFLDLLLGGTRKNLAFDPQPHLPAILLVSQIALICFETTILAGFKPRLFIACCLVARGIETWMFPLNDFVYYLVTALILSYPSTSPKEDRWVNQVLLTQTAWIYFSTALFKLSPIWLTGGELYVRQNYLLASRNWAYPAFYVRWISDLNFNRVLAWIGVSAEFAVALILIYLLYLNSRSKSKSRWGYLAIGVSAGVHLFGALSTNVWFFGASIFAQVFYSVI